MKKAGSHNVRIMVLGEYPVEELGFWESHWITALREAGYNLTNVADGGRRSGFPKGYYKHSPETRVKMSKSLKGNAPWRGKKRSEADRAAISAGLRKFHDAKVALELDT